MSAESTTMFEEGKHLLQVGDFQKAMETLYAATQNDPADTRPYGYLGMALVRLGDLPNGIAWLQGAAQHQPNDAASHYNLAVALAQAQRMPEAKTALEAALAANPQHAQARAALDKINASLPQNTLPALNNPAMPQYATPATPGGATGGYNATPAPEVTEPGLASGGLPMPAYATPQPIAPQGMQYNASANRRTEIIPTTAQRIGRGLGWGALYGQWWTLWIVFWSVVLGAITSNQGFMLFMLAAGLIAGIGFAFVGSIVGLIIGATNSEEDQGAIIGVVAGLLLFGIERLLSAKGLGLSGIIFWFFSGRYVGRNIAAKVQKTTYL